MSMEIPDSFFFFSIRIFFSQRVNRSSKLTATKRSRHEMNKKKSAIELCCSM